MQTLRIDILLYQDGRYWIAHCVQLDIVVSGVDREMVWADAQRACAAQLEYALTNDRDFEHLFRPQSPELMRMMTLAKDEGQLIVQLDGRLAETRPAEPRPVVVLHRLAAAA